MIERSRTHLNAARETYWQHFRFASTFGLLAMAAGTVALIHAVIPALCTHTASRIIWLLSQLIDDRHKIDQVEASLFEAMVFIQLLILATVVVAPLWLLDAHFGVTLAYTVLAFMLPATLLLSNPNLESRDVA